MANRKRLGSPLAQLRKALDKKQVPFAEMIGRSRSLVEQIERGQKPVSKNLRTQLMLLFGCDPRSFRTSQGKLRILRARKRTLKEAIDEWEKLLPITADDTNEILEKKLVPKLRVLFRAAGNRQLALILTCMLDDWITDAVKKLKIKGAVDHELAIGNAGISVGDWPLIRFKIDNASFELEICLSDETANLVGKKRSHAFIRSRGILQVNPDKGKRLLDIFGIAPPQAGNALGRPASTKARSSKGRSGFRK